MTALIDLTGQRFGACVVLGRAPNKPRDRNARWRCRCDCGREMVRTHTDLRRFTTGRCIKCAVQAGVQLRRERAAAATAEPPPAPTGPIPAPAPGWRDKAACQGHDPELFVPEDLRRWHSQDAVEICAGCPVLSSCAADLLTLAQPWAPQVRAGLVVGETGATTAQQRANVVRKIRRRAVRA